MLPSESGKRCVGMSFNVSPCESVIRSLIMSLYVESN